MRFLKIPTLLAALALALACPATAATEWLPLFNGNDFTGWESFLGPEKTAPGETPKPLGLNNDPHQVFTIVLVDGAPAIRLSGEGYGVLSTKKSYANYHLRFQFKWGTQRFSPDGKPRNGGLMYHAYGTYGELTGRWTPALQFQIAEGTCGDFIVMGDATGRTTAHNSADGKSTTYDPTGSPLLVAVQSDNKGKCTRSKNFESPVGEWNTFELLCLDDQVLHLVNGHLVARATSTRKAAAPDGSGGTPLTSGPIQLQLEMAEMFFRKIELREIDALPSALAETPN